MQKEVRFLPELANRQITFDFTNNPTIDEREMHPYHEILLCINGDIEILTANGSCSLKESSIMIIPEETYHFSKPKKDTDFVRLKISFPTNILENTPLSEIMSDMKIVDDFKDETKLIFDRLCMILKENTKNAPFYAYSAFLMLISELHMHGLDVGRQHYPKANQLMTSLTEYISENLSKNLDISSIAKEMHVSPSSITHLFKKEFGIPLHKYIIQKRLVCAKRLICEGEQLSKIYADIGFRDYSSFTKHT